MMWPDNLGFHFASELPADPKSESMVKDMNAVQRDCMHLAVAQAQVPDVDPDDEMVFLPRPPPPAGFAAGGGEISR